jgi:glycosyltransferase involved in cell wall biosynthesis
MRPNWSFAMVGPVVKVDPADFPRLPNIHWLGGRDYQDLPGYCKAFDVCMMLFALNEATEYINPTKALEYLATGRPVISTPVADVVRQYSDLVYIERDAPGFVSRIELLLSHPEDSVTQRGLAKVAGCSWDNTVARMQELIADATGIGPATPIVAGALK